MSLLGYLVTVGQVAVEVVFALEHAAAVHVGAERESGAHGLVDCGGVEHGQGAREGGIKKAYPAVFGRAQNEVERETERRMKLLLSVREPECHADDCGATTRTLWYQVPVFLLFFLFFCTLLSSFWTSRGHRCRPFPPVLAFSFYRA